MRRYSQIVRIVTTYAVLSAAWIVLTDMTIARFVGDTQLLTRWQTAKGWVFVVMSSALIFGLLWRERRLRRNVEAIAADAHRRFEKIFQNNAAAQAISTIDEGVIVEANKAFADMFGYAREDLIGHKVPELRMWADPDERARAVATTREQGSSVARESTFLDRQGNPIEAVWSAERIDLGGVPHLLAAMIDVTARKRSERRAEELNADLTDRIGRLEALRQIDIAITENRELAKTLLVVVEQMCARLELDSVAILLADPETGELAFGTARGYRTREPARVALALSEAYLASRPNAVGWTHLDEDDLARALSGSDELAHEGFSDLIAVPLRTQGMFEGLVLAAQRSSLELGDDALDFLQAMALQAAIAIANARLVEGLARSNRELRHAYERTIEGWAHALDLKDEETQEHSLRVTQLTERLARRLDVPESDMMHIRRGALLHDVGKIGVPDRILLKPGPLTAEERALMERHTEYARDMLEDIEFLECAMDIPYCHHERWDGTGYPRGLAGEEIPLPARIFAVVDVYDALGSERPYRPAWNRERVVAHLRAERGKQFDPVVVDEFLRLIGA